MNAINQLQTQRVPTGQRAKLLGVAFALLLAVAAPSPAADDPVAPWKQDVRIAPVSPTPGRHTTHSYYVANPESPDGKRVLFFASTHPAAHMGNVVMLDRATGKFLDYKETVFQNVFSRIDPKTGEPKMDRTKRGEDSWLKLSWAVTWPWPPTGVRKHAPWDATT